MIHCFGLVRIVQFNTKVRYYYFLELTPVYIYLLLPGSLEINNVLSKFKIVFSLLHVKVIPLKHFALYFIKIDIIKIA